MRIRRSKGLLKKEEKEKKVSNPVSAGKGAYRLKVRVWDIKDKKMYYTNSTISYPVDEVTDLILYDGGYGASVWYIDDTNLHRNKRMNSDECIITKWTGCIDKYKREIYEEDIIEWVDGVEKRHKGRVLYKRSSYFIWEKTSGDYFLFPETDKIKVVGNTFEDPGLLI